VPATVAGEVARINRRRHLYAAFAVDVVERLLVAPDHLRQAGLRPVTELHAAVLADDPVALPLQDFLLLRIHPAPDDRSRLKGFRGVALRSSRLTLRPGTQGEQVDLAHRS